jgi:ABC-type phosphate transport system substrate-binding protein
MNRTTVAAAVAAVLAGGSAFAQPTVTQIAAVPAANTINIAGSSAIKTALLNNIYINFCGAKANATTVTSNGTNKNFTGISCTPVSGAATNSGIYNVWVRVEGGSVSGYLPIVNNVAIKQIDGPSLTANPLTINGASTGNGVDDSFSVSAGGALIGHKVDLGIGDVEPKALIGNNYPTAYSTAVWGAQNQTGMFGKSGVALVDEVYAVFVNETGVSNGGTSPFTENPLVLSQETVAAILTHGIKNWSQVTDINGNSVSSAFPITIVNREAGSGSRAATDILLVGDGCSSAGKATKLYDAPGATDYFSTGDVLTAASSITGAISYATIDNDFANGGSTSFPNMTMVNLNGVVPTNLAAASGNYPFWVEASFVDNSAATGADETAIQTIIQGLQNSGTTSSIADINAIPDLTLYGTTTQVNNVVHANAANSAITPTGGSVTIYINPYTRNDVTCSTPTSDINTYP